MRKSVDNPVSYRPMAPGEEPQVLGLAERMFNEFVRADFTREGVEEFSRAAKSMIFDRPDGHVILVAATPDNVVGMIALKDYKHISLFFVDSACHGQGIGKALLRHAIEHCSLHAPAIDSIDVHSSLYAVPIYERLGFRQTKPEQTKNGIRFVEMVKSLNRHRA